MLLIQSPTTKFIQRIITYTILLKIQGILLREE